MPRSNWSAPGGRSTYVETYTGPGPQPGPAPTLPTWLPQPETGPTKPPGSQPPPWARRDRARSRSRGRAARTGRKGWIPAVAVLGVLIAANVLPHLHFGLGSAKPPPGVAAAVNGYFQAVEQHSAQSAVGYVCSANRKAWTADQKKNTGDLKRGISTHSVGGTVKTGNAYDVDVSLGQGRVTAPVSIMVHVVNEAGRYKVCGGPGQ